MSTEYSRDIPDDQEGPTAEDLSWKEPEGPREFRVHEESIPWLDRKFARMAKVAAEVGASPPTYKVVREEFEDRWEPSPFANEVDAEGHPRRIKVGVDKFLIITVEGEPPKLAGWKFIARITPTETLDKDGAPHIANIISTMPGVEDPVPAKYRTAPPYCDYCMKSRRRIDSFLVRNEKTGEYKQVGRNCLAKFLGFSNPERVARYASWFADLKKEIHDHDEDFLRAGRPALYHDLVEFLTMVAAVTDEKGWVTSKQAQETGKAPSVWEVHNQLDQSWRSDMKSRHRYDMLITPTEEHKEAALKAIAWARSDNLVPDTDYKHNLKISTATEAFHQKAAGVVASLLVFKNRCETSDRERERWKQEREAERAKLRSSQHVGKIGERITIPAAQLMRKRELQGQFGRTDMCRFLDPDNNVIVWFASGGEYGTEEGGEYSLTCTVKRHETYEGINQTIVTRCKVGPPGEVTGPAKKKPKARSARGNRKVESSLSGVSR